MVEALVILAPGFEEIEAVAVIDVLRRSGIKVTVAGLHPEMVEGAHELKIVPDKTIEKKMHVSILSWKSFSWTRQ